jgi:ComF family protein
VNPVSASHQFKELALDLLFPRHCVGCGRGGALLCSQCRSTLQYLSPPLCDRCGLPIRDGNMCLDCENAATDIDGIRSLFPYDGAIQRAIIQLKYQNVRALASPLAQLMWEYQQTQRLPADVLMPVPLHPRRLRSRGYNQSGLLASELGRFASLPVVDDSVIRRKNTAPQARTTSVEDRRRNVAGAFACRDKRGAGKHIIVIDDVCTSSATLRACAAALKAEGAVSVWGLTLAREV